MQNNSILTPTSSSSATPGTRFLVRATSFARQALQAHQKRMESPDVVAQNADVAADDAGSGGTVIDLDVMTREALCTLLAPFSSGASSAEAAPRRGRLPCCRFRHLPRQHQHFAQQHQGFSSFFVALARPASQSLLRVPKIEYQVLRYYY